MLANKPELTEETLKYTKMKSTKILTKIFQSFETHSNITQFFVGYEQPWNEFRSDTSESIIDDEGVHDLETYKCL